MFVQSFIHLFDRNRSLIASFCNNAQIVNVLNKFIIILDLYYNICFSAFVVNIIAFF